MNREQEMVSIACKAIDDKKALDIKVIDIREAVSYTHLTLPTKLEV